MVERWALVEAKHAMEQYDEDKDSYMNAAEVEKAHDTLWYLTHPPDLVLGTADKTEE